MFESLPTIVNSVSKQVTLLGLSLLKKAGHSTLLSNAVCTVKRWITMT